MEQEEKSFPRLPRIKLKLPLGGASRVNWPKVGLIAISIIWLAYFVCAVVAGVGLYKSHFNNKFNEIFAKILPYPAAIVGSNVITMDNLGKEVGYIEYFYQKTAPDQTPDISLIEKQVVDRLIQEKVIEKLARKNGVSVSSKDVDEQFKKIADENGGEEKVGQILADLYGLDAKSFKHLIEAQLLQEKLRDKFEQDLQMQVKVRHILVKAAPDAAPETKAAAQAKAADLLSKVKGGADFAETAKANSEDEASQGQGGELPFFSKGQNVAEFETAAFSLNPGEISDLVETQYGFHIIKVEDKKGSINLTFEDWLKEFEKKMWTLRIMGRSVKEETNEEPQTSVSESAPTAESPAAEATPAQ